MTKNLDCLSDLGFQFTATEFQPLVRFINEKDKKSNFFKNMLCLFRIKGIHS